MGKLSRWFYVLLGALMLGFLTAACGDDASTLPGTSWQLTEVAGTQASDEAVATVTFDEAGRIAGTTGCNSFTGTYETDGAALSIGPLAATRALCASDALNAQEAAELAALGTATTWKIDGDTLQLADDSGAAVAGFVVFEPGLAGSWDVTGFNTGNEAVISVIIGTEITVEFNEDGSLSGTAGCNGYSATFEEGEATLVGGSISISAVAATERLCADPPGTMEQELQFLTALEAADVWQLTGDRLELRDSTGALQVSAAPSSA